MVDLWFFLVCAVFAAYVVLDGYDLGAGIVSPFVGRTDGERFAVLETILPHWDGNEVFLVAGGASLYLAFPGLFPALMSGFYLPVMIVLWLLALRGVAIEMRHKLDHPLWNQLWDGGFFLASAMLVVFFGAALGNVVRGVSIEDGAAIVAGRAEFFAPLWTNFGVGDDVGILDWYTLLVGLTALAAIARHGALRIAARTADGSEEERVVGKRAHRAADHLAPAVGVLTVGVSVATFLVQPLVLRNLAARPWTAGVGIVAFGALAASAALCRRGDAERAFLASSVSLVGLFGCACVGVHPYGLVARIPSRSVLAASAAADSYALGVGLAWWLPGMVLVAIYSRFVHRRLDARRHGR